MGMTEPYPQTPTGGAAAVKKDKTWIWVIVLFLVLCLCLCLVAGGVGLYLYMSGPAEVLQAPPAAEEEVPAPPEPPARPEPTPRPEPTLVPLPETLVIEAHDPLSGDYYPSLQDLVPGYNSSSLPDVQTWEASVSSDQPVVVFSGWCTASMTILEQNFEHIRYRWEADGEEVDMESMFQYDQIQNDMYCHIYAGIVWAWPLGEHTILVTMTFDAPLNDGFGDYPAGDYVDVYNITVTR